MKAVFSTIYGLLATFGVLAQLPKVDVELGFKSRPVYQNVELVDSLLDLGILSCETKSIIINCSSFSEIPPNIYKIRGLELLVIRGESDKTISEKVPCDIGQFKNLKYLVIDNVKIENIEDLEIDFPQLTHIDLYNTNINYFPSFLFKSKNLTSIVIYGSDIKRIPKEIKRLRKLETLSIGFCPLKQIPNHVFSLPNIKFLAFESCFRLNKISGDIKKSHSLTELDLTGTPITEVSNRICYLPNFQTIRIDPDRLSALPLCFVSDPGWRRVESDVWRYIEK